MDDKKRALDFALFQFNRQQPFYGSFLQELSIKYTARVPTGAIYFNTKNETFEVLLNPEYFCNHLDNDLKTSILHHELLHFTEKHLFRLPWMDASDEDRAIMNIAGDMSINQYLKRIAKGCPHCPHESEEHFKESRCPGNWVDVSEFKMDDGTSFPTFQTIETYYELIKQEREKQKRNKNTKGNVNEKIKIVHHTDAHEWEKLDDETKNKMLSEAKKVIKRTLEKTSNSHTVIPDSIRDLLQEIEVLSNKINCKEILKSAIKKSVSFVEREHTWNRPSKRFGVFSPGSKQGQVPLLTFYNDSSGSISITEQNEFLDIVSQFLKTGSRKCMLAFWHTNLYYKKPYKKGQKIQEADLQSGGTDVSCVMEDIRVTNPNLSIILTDGYFDASDVKTNSEIVWVISKGGNKDHPMKHIGKTIYLESLV